jgi:hypothetical protein
MRHDLRRFAACGAAFIGLAVFVSEAQAVPGLERVTTTTAADSSAGERVAAKCPAGKRVVGGGGEVIDGAGRVVLQRLQPKQTATDDRFVTGAHEVEEGYDGDWQLTAYALCSDPLSGQQVVGQDAEPTTSDPLQSLLALCPGTQTQVGFGGRIRGGAGQVRMTDLFLFFDPPSVTFIRAQEDANGFDGLWNVGSYAVCADGGTGFVTVAASSPADSEDKSATVDCPAGTQVHSAGAQLTGSGVSSVVIDEVSIDPGLGSVTAGAAEDATGTTGAWSVRAYALCAP